MWFFSGLVNVAGSIPESPCWGLNPKISHMLGKCSISELHPQSNLSDLDSELTHLMPRPYTPTLLGPVGISVHCPPLFQQALLEDYLA